MITALTLIFLIGKKFEDVIINYAKIETERIASIILNDVIKMSDKKIDNDFYKVIRDSKGNIQVIDFDNVKTNKILTYINKEATKKLNDLEKGKSRELELSDALKGVKFTYINNGIVCDIPLGVLYNNSLLVNLTPSVPIKFSFIGTVSSKIVTDVKEYGVNSALISISLLVTIKEQVTMPHTVKSVSLDNKVALVTQVVQGEVPYYYNPSY